MKLLHSLRGPAILAQLRQVSQRRAQLPLLLRATLLLQGPLRRPLFLHLNNLPARGRIPSHQLVMILRLHKSFQRASYTDRRRRRLRPKAIISDLPAFLLMCLKFCTRMVALARNLLTQEWSILPSDIRSTTCSCTITRYRSSRSSITFPSEFAMV